MVGFGGGVVRFGQPHVLSSVLSVMAAWVEPTEGKDFGTMWSEIQASFDKNSLSVDGVKYTN